MHFLNQFSELFVPSIFVCRPICICLNAPTCSSKPQLGPRKPHDLIVRISDRVLFLLCLDVRTLLASWYLCLALQSETAADHLGHARHGHLSLSRGSAVSLWWKWRRCFDHKVLWREPLSSLLFGTALNLVKIIIKGYVLSTPHSNDFNLFVRPIWKSVADVQLFWAQWGGLHFVRLCPWLLLSQHPAHAWESVSSFWEDLPFGLPRWAVVEKNQKFVHVKWGLKMI